MKILAIWLYLLMPSLAVATSPPTFRDLVTKKRPRHPNPSHLTPKSLSGPWQAEVQKALGLPATIQLEALPHAPQWGLVAPLGQTIRFWLEGFPFCEYQLKRHQTKAGRIFYLGEAPPSFHGDPSKAWPSLQKVLAAIEPKIREVIPSDPTVIQAQECLVVRDGRLVAGLSITLEASGLRYRILADPQEVYEAYPMFVHSDATARIYAPRSTGDSLQDYHLEGMVEDGSLENAWFFSTREIGENAPLAMSVDGRFEFVPGTEFFEQTSVFVHANIALAWFKAAGYDGFGFKPIRLMSHVTAHPGDARYVPDYFDYPTVSIGADAEVGLRNLHLDADVVSHELAHHVIYDSLKVPVGETLVLHEGLADYLATQISGQACFAPAVCSQYQGAEWQSCYEGHRCLRSAATSLRLDGSYAAKEGTDILYSNRDNSTLPAHILGQVVSGYLWDLVVKDGFQPQEVVHLTLATIGLLAERSGYRDFILAMLKAESSLMGGRRCMVLHERAIARGFSSSMGDLRCGEDLPEIQVAKESRPTGGPPSTPRAEEATEAEGASESDKGCGVVAGHLNGLSLIWFGMPLLMLRRRSSIWAFWTRR